MEARVYPESLEPGWEWNVARLFPRRGEWGEEDYLSLPDNRGVELSEGCLEFLPMPTEQHQIILGYLYRAFFDFVSSRQLGTVLMAGIPVRLWKDKIREPDVVFRSRERARPVDGRYWDGADLAVEIVSQGGRKRDLEEKRREYARAGISEYWIVDPENCSIQILVLEGDEYRPLGVHLSGDQAASVLLPGFVVSVEAVFTAEQ
ncbi:MAG: Uma2 family endonuclease [Actinomycetota bacterium]